MTKPNRSWTFDVIRGHETVARYQVPVHRIEKRGVAELLRILVAKYEALNFEETINAFLNNRKGGPTRSIIGEPQYFIQYERAQVGYYLFGPTVYAQATYEISRESCEFFRQLQSPSAA
jgi:hypothetical protein